jgi:hypothetical protein
MRKKPTTTLDLQPQDFPRSDPAELAAFDPSTKVCTMNCTPCRVDPRSAAERKLQCDDCYPAPPPASPSRCPCCADLPVLQAQVDSLKAALLKVLDTRDAEAKAHFTYQTALDNYGPEGRAREASNHMRAMTAASSAERGARLLLATLKTIN